MIEYTASSFQHADASCILNLAFSVSNVYSAIFLGTSESVIKYMSCLLAFF